MAYDPARNFRGGAPSVWTDESKAFVIEGYMLHSATELMHLVKEKFGIAVSRNAVIGVVNRAGKQKGRSPTNFRPRKPKTDAEMQAIAAALAEKKRIKQERNAAHAQARAAVQAINAGKTAAERASLAEVGAMVLRAEFDEADRASLVPPDELQGIPFADREMDQCAYPVHGSRAVMMVCGGRCVRGKSYCAHHMIITCTGA